MDNIHLKSYIASLVIREAMFHHYISIKMAKMKKTVTESEGQVALS